MIFISPAMLALVALLAWRSRRDSLALTCAVLLSLDMIALVARPSGPTPHEGAQGLLQRLNMFSFAAWPGVVVVALMRPGARWFAGIMWGLVALGVAASYPMLRGDSLIELYIILRVVALLCSLTIIFVAHLDGEALGAERRPLLALVIGGAAQLVGPWLWAPVSRWWISHVISALTYATMGALVHLGGAAPWSTGSRPSSPRSPSGR